MELSLASTTPRTRRVLTKTAFAWGVWGVVAIVSLLVGASRISLVELWYSLLSGFGVDVSDVLSAGKASIFWHIRLPRLFLASAVGAGLGVAGGAIQGLLRNPLAEPGLLGVSSGAALFTIFGLVLGLQVGSVLGAFVLPLFAFAGALVFTFLVFGLARWIGTASGIFLILAGIGITALVEAVIGFTITLYTDDATLRTFTFWRMGGLAGASWTSLLLALPLILLPIFGMVRLGAPLDALALGEREAELMGVRVGPTKARLIVLSALSVGAAVSVSGQIAFVGLAVPHIVRMWVGARQTRVLPLAAAVGAGLLLAADTLARVVVAPAELPVGLFTAVLGAPTLLWILTRDFRRLQHA